jgi:hypothetical protein
MEDLCNEDYLMALAAAVADGTPVDWAEAASRAQTEEQKRTIRYLQALAGVVTVHRPGRNAAAVAVAPAATPVELGADAPTTLMDGRFVVERSLGKGGFGVVYQAYDSERKARLALKSLNRSDVGSIYDLKKEFRTLADLSHPNLVSLYELFADRGQWFIAMELVSGIDFLRYVRPDGACNPHRLEQALCQLAEALCYLHAHGKLHRDIKPSNVLMTSEGTLKLLDFGLMTDLAPDAGGDTVPIRGTPAYVSPEQAVGDPATEASDWYSVGVILFEALTGERPFSGTPMEVIAAKQDRDPPSPSGVCDGLPERLDALCRDLLERRPAMRPSDAEVLTRLRRMWPPATVQPAAARRREHAPFIGRDAQLSTLARAFDRSTLGRAQMVYLHGGSGMGKTALIRRFLEQLRERDPEVVILEGRCYERESVPYKALDSLVDRLSRYLKRLPGAEAEALLPRDVWALTRLFPILRRVDAVANARQRLPQVTNAQELRRRGFAAFRELLARVSDRHPVVLVIDDLQWGDADSAALIADLIRTPEPPPLLFIACYRSEDAFSSAALRTLLFVNEEPAAGSDFDVHEVTVDELTEVEARELATALSRAYGVSTGVSSIVRESERSPFFIDELIQYSAALATASDAASADAIAELDASSELTLDAVILARTGRLSEGACRLLRVLAVFGGPLKRSLAAEAAGLERGALEELAELRTAHLTRTRSGGAEDEIEVYHDRIRDAVVAQIGAPDVRVLHARLASVLEGSADADPETLLLHFLGAGQRENASSYALTAANRAREALAFDRAAGQYRLALDLGRFDAATQRDIRIKLGDALAASGRGYDAAQAYLSAVDGALAAEVLDLKRRAADQLLRSGHIDEGLAAIRAVLDALGMSMPASPARALLSLLARRTWIRLRGLGFHDRDPSQLSAEALVRVDACWSVATAIGVVDTICGADFQSRHLLLALDTGDPYRISRALAVEIAYTALAGTRTVARQQMLTAMARQLAERVRQPEPLALVTLATGTAFFLQGKWKPAHEYLERAEPLLQECASGNAWELDTTYLYHLLALFYLGEIKELSTRLPIVLRAAHERDDLTAATNLRTRTAYIMHLAADNPTQAREEVRQGMARWARDGFHAQHSWELYACGEIDLYTGRGPEAWNYVTGRWPALRRSLLLRIQAVRIESLYLRARAALAAAVDPSASLAKRGRLVAKAEADARRLSRENAAWADALAALILSGAATVKYTAQEAAARLEAAESAFDGIDMRLHAAVARRRRGEVLGGTEGERLVQQADGWMMLQAIRNPANMAGMLAPGAYGRTLL